MKMTVQDALNAARDAETEGLLGKYPMAARTLAQELNHHVAKNALLTPEVQRAQDKCRELKGEMTHYRELLEQISKDSRQSAISRWLRQVVRAMLRFYWRCLPHSLKPSKLQSWHKCHGDAVVDYYWRWHWVRISRGFGCDGANWNYYKESYGHAWYE